MKEFLSSTMPADVGQALIVGCGLLLVGLLGVVVGTATERGRTRHDLAEVFTDPETAKAIFIARWSATAPTDLSEYAEELWDDSEHFQRESAAVARIVHELVTDELGL
jgi:hypothetical protein